MTAVMERRIQPTVLLVEDKPDILRYREELFQRGGFATVVAGSYIAALSRFRSTPGICLLATDINLDPDDETNRDGFKLAEDVESIIPDLPKVALSGVISEDAFSNSPKASLFRDFFRKASGFDKLNAKIPLWREWAVQYLERRVTVGDAEINRLRDKYGISDYDLAMMREFIPVPIETGADVTAFLASKGYRLQIIEATDLVQSASELEYKFKRAVPIWVHEQGDGVVAELYGYPQIFAFGHNAADATQSIVALMYGYFRDFVDEPSDSQDSDSPLVIQIRQYLISVFWAGSGDE